MAKKGGAPENLNPVRTKDEAKKRGRNGGIKSGQARRKKRDAKNAMNLLLDMAATGNLEENLKSLGVDENDRTNMVALQARLFTMAMGGNLQAYDRIMTMSGNDPEENRKERESRNADRRKDAESKARIEARRNADGYDQYGASDEDPFDEEEEDDVIIVMPYNGRVGTPQPKDIDVNSIAEEEKSEDEESEEEEDG